MKYAAFYYKPVTAHEIKTNRRDVIVYGMFLRKRDGVESIKQRFQNDELVKGCVSAELVRRSDMATVFSIGE